MRSALNCKVLEEPEEHKERRLITENYKEEKKNSRLPKWLFSHADRMLLSGGGNQFFMTLQ